MTLSSRSKDALGFTGLVPTEQEWKAYNDPTTPGRQEVLCVVWKQDRAPLAGTLVG